MTRRRTAMVVAVLLLAGAGTVALVRARPQCGDEWRAVVDGASDPVLRPIEDLRSTDPSFADYADVIDQAQGFGAPFGALSSASPGAGGTRLQDSTLMPAGDHVVLDSYSDVGEVKMVDLSSGEVEWTRTYQAQPLVGGLTGGAFVNLVRPLSDNSVLLAPVMTAFDPVDGSMFACATVGSDVQTTDAHDDKRTHVVRRIGDDFLVVVPRETKDRPRDTHGTALSMSRVVPSTGGTAWTIALDQGAVDNVGALDIIDDVALLSTVDATDRTTFVGLFPSGQGTPDADPKVVAYSTDDGRQLWDFPDPTSGTEPLYVTVVGTDPKTGIIVIESGKGLEPGKHPLVLERTLTALDVSGKVLWSKTVADSGNPQPDFAAVLGSTVVIRPWADQESRLFGWSITDGSEMWSAAAGGTPLQWAHAAQLDGLWLVPTLFGITVIDPATGLVGQHVLLGGAKQIVVNDERIVLNTYAGRLLVFDRQAPA